MIDSQEIRRLLLRSAARDRGSAEAFERLYALCAPALLGIAQRIVQRRELAEEVLHDAFTAIWRAAERFDPLAPQPFSWMAAIVRNRAIDVRSSADMARVDFYPAAEAPEADRALERMFDWSPQPDESEDRRRAVLWLRECLSRLKSPERQALVLAFAHGLSHRDLAAHLQRPLGTVKTWIRRGLASLRECMEASMDARR
ncbi:MAG: sigma-70 family RNA polymerase sigma factor [Betaproteobacteria bacterium]